MIEIERKFLVRSEHYKDQAQNQKSIKQGFLNSDAKRVVRVRIEDEQGTLTVKGPSKDGGISRFEWETNIPLKDAEKLLDLCERPLIEKIRYQIPVTDHTFEVDEFQGDNKGLVVAEIELSHREETFERPAWLGEEVTGKPEYYNSNLITHPYKNWKK